MLYVIIGEDTPGTLDQRLAARPAHVERLQALQADGRLMLTWRDQFQIVIDCRDETEQRRLFERFTAEGLACRVSVL